MATNALRTAAKSVAAGASFLKSSWKGARTPQSSSKSKESADSILGHATSTWGLTLISAAGKASAVICSVVSSAVHAIVNFIYGFFKTPINTKDPSSVRRVRRVHYRIRRKMIGDTLIRLQKKLLDRGLVPTNFAAAASSDMQYIPLRKTFNKRGATIRGHRFFREGQRCVVLGLGAQKGQFIVRLSDSGLMASICKCFVQVDGVNADMAGWELRAISGLISISECASSFGELLLRTMRTTVRCSF